MLRARLVRHATSALLVVAGTLACASLPGGPPSPTPRQQRVMDIYNTLFDEAVSPERPVPISVEVRTVRYVPPPADAARAIREQLAAIPAGLSAQLAMASARTRDVRTLPLPAGVHVLSDEPSAIQDVGLGDPPIFAISPVVFSDDGFDAFVYVEQRCGPGCSGGSAIWLALTVGGAWERQGEVTIWLG